MMNEPIVYALTGFFSGIALFYRGFRKLQKRRFIENMPTSRTRSCAMGIVEIIGEVVPIGNALLKSPLTYSDCVYYRFTRERRDENNIISPWITVEKTEDYLPFDVKDETGVIKVDPMNAEFDLPPDHRALNSLKERISEFYIAPGDQVYVLGNACSDELNGRVIKKGQAEEPFYISDRTESALLNDLGRHTYIGVFAGPIISLVCLFIILFEIGLI